MPRKLLPFTIVLAFAVAGCADPAGQSTAGPSPTVASPTAPSPTPSSPSSPLGDPGRPGDPQLPTLEPPSGPPKQPTDVFKPVTVRGVVRVSGSCRELVTDTVTWTLVGQTAATLADGTTIELTGLPNPRLETGCTGSPLQVQSVRSN